MVGLSIGVHKTETLIERGTRSEVNSAQPTPEGNFVIIEAGDNPRLVEVSPDGEIVLEFPLACQQKNHHMQTRMAHHSHFCLVAR